MEINDKVYSQNESDSEERMHLHFLTLSFKGGLEKLFAKSIFENKKYILQIRIVLLITILFYSAFGLLDVVLVPNQYEKLFIIRFAVVCPFILLAILFSYTKSYEKYIQLSFILVTLVAGAGIIFMIVIIPPPATYSYYAGLILVFMFIYTFGRVRFIWATLLGWLLIIFYEISAIFYTSTPMPVLINNNFFFISANLIGMVSCYLFEYYDRRNFFTARQLKIEKRRTKEINQKLEQRVFERTALLNKSNEDLKLEIEERKRIENELRTISNELEIRVENRTFDLVNANRELEKAKEEADASALAKSEFLANMSHEIRNPMNAIIGMAELAMNDKIHFEQRNRYLDIIRTSSRSLLVIINDILDLSKIEAGKLEFDLRPFNIRDYVESVGDIFITELSAKGIELIVDVASDVPYLAIGDPVRLQQVLLNLVGNALKFTETGEICIKLTRGDTSDNKIELLFEVSDTGIGIDLYQKQNLFEAFAQADSSITRRYGGTGLGLAICKRIVNFMNGNIHVESRLGEGSTFKFSVILERDIGSGIEKEKRKKLDALDILVVIANTKLQDVCIKILTSFGFYVTAAKNPSEAVEKIKQIEKNREYDLFIIDDEVPEQDCGEVLESLKSAMHNSLPPVLLLGNVKTKSEITELQSKGVTNYLSKPLKSSSLFDSIIVLFNNVKSKQNKNFDQYPIPEKVKGMNILLVEDNPINQTVAREVLALGSVNTTIAGNGAEAVEILEKKSFDVILMDVQMPKLDGIEATKIIRETLKIDIPIIAMTAHVMQGDREKCENAGMDDFISKPIDREYLFKVLEKYISGNEKEDFQESVPADESASIKLDGVDIADALKRLNCDHRIFSEILYNFCDYYKDILTVLESCYTSGDMKKLRYEVHSIKGAASNVSAFNLYLAAKDLEDALDVGEDEFYSNLINDIGTKLQEVIASGDVLMDYVAQKEKEADG